MATLVIDPSPEPCAVWVNIFCVPQTRNPGGKPVEYKIGKLQAAWNQSFVVSSRRVSAGFTPLPADNGRLIFTVAPQPGRDSMIQLPPSFFSLPDRFSSPCPRRPLSGSNPLPLSAMTISSVLPAAII